MILKNKVAIITGGGTGIGRATSILLAKEGANVIIVGRRIDKLKEVVDKVGAENIKIDHIVADVSKEEDCRNVVNQAIGRFGRIDILFNNAGVLHKATTHQTTTEQWVETFDINVKSVYLMSKYVIKEMLKRNYGVIINNSSILGIKASPGFAAYNSSKGAVNQLTRSMALEYADKNIRVNAICPGTIYTPLVYDMFEQWGDIEAAEKKYISVHPINRLGTPDEIAHSVLFLCDDKVSFMTGAMLSIDGGLSAK